MNIFEKLAKIQSSLKVPKDQNNNFGKYKYRSCEDILSKVKPLLGDCILTLTDDVINLGDRFYIKSIATLNDGDGAVSVSGFAREDLNKKGMDQAQLTGSCSSYARKYALNGLFLLDDTKEIDSMNNKATTQATKQAVKPTKQENVTTAPPAQEKTQEEIDKGLAVREMKECKKKNAILFDIVADNLGIYGKTPAQLSLYQCNKFIDEFIQRDK